jgi:hypothetical protein
MNARLIGTANTNLGAMLNAMEMRMNGTCKSITSRGQVDLVPGAAAGTMMLLIRITTNMCNMYLVWDEVDT